MSVEATKQLIFALIDEVWNEHDPAAVARFFGPGLREEIAEQQRQLLGGFPDLRVTVEGDLIADGELVVARLTPTGTHLGTFAGQAATGRVVSWSPIRIYRVKDGKVVETWAMQDRLALLQQVGAIAEPVAVNWAGGANPDTERSA